MAEIEYKTFETILEEVNEDLKSNAGVPIDTSADSIMSIWNASVVRQISKLWELGEAINDSTDILKAEDEALDDLALRVGRKRTPARRTRGTAWFKGTEGVVIPTSAKMASSRGDRFQPVANVLISSTACLEATVQVGVLLNQTDYQITINSVQYNYTSDSSATKEDIVNGFITTMAGGSVLFTPTNVDDELHIVAVDKGLDLVMSSSTYLSFDDIVSRGSIESVDFGLIAGDPKAIVHIESSINGWDEVINDETLIIGKVTQSNDELRIDILTNYGAKESSTYEGVRTRLLGLQDVEAVVVQVNRTWVADAVTDPTISLPPKSYHCTVHGGVSADIASAIWETQPLGIEVVGHDDHNIIDKFGQPQVVSFSRPTVTPIFMRIVVDKHDEETYPVNGAELIANTVFEQAAKLTIGDDVFAQRFVGDIYRNVAGISNVTITLSNTSSNLTSTVLTKSSTEIATLPLSNIILQVNG